MVPWIICTHLYYRWGSLWHKVGKFDFELRVGSVSEEQSGLFVVVKPHLEIPCLSVTFHVYVEMCLAVLRLASNDALHNSFEGSEPVVEFVV
jgi:hypothetical protein